MGLMKLGRPGSTRGEAGSHCCLLGTGAGGGAGNPAFREQMEQGVTRCSPVCAGGPLQGRSAAGLVGRGLLVKSVTECPPHLCEVSPGRETWVPGSPLFYGCKLFSSQMKETCVCARLGEGMPSPAHKALARRGTFAAKQIFFQTSPRLPGRGVSRPQSGQGAAGLPKPPTAAPLGFEGRLVARLATKRPSGGKRARERERDRGRSRGKGGREGQETRRSSKKEGGRWPGPRGRFATAPADGARRGPGGGIAGEERASGASARPAGAGEGASGAGALSPGRGGGASVSRRGPVTFLGRGRGAGRRGRGLVGRQSALRPAGSMWRPMRRQLKGTARRARHTEALPPPPAS